MRIGEVATRTEVGVQTLRYYERRGLLPVPRRRPSGYRNYAEETVQRVRFIRRAQELGFTLDDINDLLSLWPDSTHSCDAVQRRAAVALERIDTKLRDLRRMRSALARFATACRDRSSLDGCPLLAALDTGKSRSE